jgi:predicted RNA polymerase sigma factor
VSSAPTHHTDHHATHRAIDVIWRMESARIIAGLTRIVRDVGLAEELAQDALVAALERWPASGIPVNPGAWLMATAKHCAIDMWCRNKLLERKHEELGRELETQQELSMPDFNAALDDEVGDDLLRLVFISCHPALASEARVALTVRLLGGLATDEIARAFLVPEPARFKGSHNQKRKNCASNRQGIPEYRNGNSRSYGENCSYALLPSGSRAIKTHDLNLRKGSS